jgi:SSS family solute:Na+ symporter
VVKLGALFFILVLPTQYAIQLQLLGGIWIIQTLPSVLLGLYTRKLHPTALLIGWACGIGAGTWMAAQSAFKTSTYALNIFGTVLPCYAALSSLVLNIAVAAVLSAVFNALSNAPRVDATLAEDYV